jgi:hypothetical protein
MNLEEFMSYKDQREILIEEYPNGCVLSKDSSGEILIANPWDAMAIIASLGKMLSIQYLEYGDIIIKSLEEYYEEKHNQD